MAGAQDGNRGDAIPVTFSPSSPARDAPEGIAAVLAPVRTALLERLDLRGQLPGLIRLPRDEPQELFPGFRQIAAHEIRLGQVLVRLRVLRLDEETLLVGREGALPA